MNFIIDTRGQVDLTTKHKLVDSDDDDVEIGEVGIDPSLLQLNKESVKKKKIDPSKDFDLDEFESEMGWKKTKKPNLKQSTSVEKIVKEITPLDKVLQKSLIKPGFEQFKRVRRYDMTDKKLRKIRKRQREKTKGKKWFNMPATEMTEEVKHDLEIIQMRSVLDPKRFFKKNDIQALPKYFQIGKVVDSPVDFYNNRLTKKERKRTIVDELMADAEFAKYNKRKYKEIIDEKKKMHYKAHRHARKLKGKKK